MLKTTIILVSLFCAMVNANPTFQPGRRLPPLTDIRPTPTFPRPLSNPMYRFRREAQPQDRGSVTLDMKNQPPSIDLNYNHHLMKDNRGHLDAYGGANYDMHRVRPHAGLEFERNYNNGFIRGRGEVMPGPRGRLEPQIMLGTGFRF